MQIMHSGDHFNVPRAWWIGVLECLDLRFYLAELPIARERQVFADMWRERRQEKKKKIGTRKYKIATHSAVSNSFGSCLGKYLILCTLGRRAKWGSKKSEKIWTRAKHGKEFVRRRG